MSVKATHRDYDRMFPKWERAADCVSGQDAIHAGGIKYLPKLHAEKDDDYKARRARSDFFNATWRTISGLSGMAFRKEPIYTVPAAIEPYLHDIDMAGLTASAFARGLVEEVLESGRAGVLVDYPPMPANVESITKAADEAQGLRPKMLFYDAKTIRNWHYARRRNAWALVMVVLGEDAPIPGKDEWEETCEPRYRVLDLDEKGFYRQRLFRVNERGEDELVEGPIYPTMNLKKLDYLPFRINGRNGMSARIEEPPTINLVNLNIAHYQINSDYRHGLHFTGLPTAVVSGYTPADEKAVLTIGATAAWIFPDPQAKAAYLEFTGQGLGALKEALADLEMRMALLGARMIADETAQAETLGATQIKRAGENGVLASIVIGVSQCMEWALGVMAEWAGAGGKVEYAINREFMPVPMGAQELTALVGAWQAGGLSDGELFDMFKRGDIIAADKTLEEHQAEIDKAPPMPKPVVAPPSEEAA